MPHLQGSPGGAGGEAGEGVHAGTCCVGGQQGYHQAMDVVQGQGMQNAVVGLPGPGLPQGCCLGCQAGMGVQNACAWAESHGQQRVLNALLMTAQELVQ